MLLGFTALRREGEGLLRQRFLTLVCFRLLLGRLVGVTGSTVVLQADASDASVGASVGAAVGASVVASVGESVGASVGALPAAAAAADFSEGVGW